MKPAPWNDSQYEIDLKFPVTCRASIRAISFASDPPGQNRTRVIPPGAIETSFFAAATAVSFVYRLGQKVKPESSCFRTASRIFG